jgi:LCP family protein required for cell wall assembly
MGKKMNQQSPGSEFYTSLPSTLQEHQNLTRWRRMPGCACVLIVLSVLLLILAGALAVLFFSVSSPLSQIVGQQASCAQGIASNADQGRINILLLGSDNDQKFQGQPLAQTDIVVTIDPTSNAVGMLSIPRDFFLNVPGYGMHKLDEAYSLGGVGLSCLTIEQDFGIPLNYYAWVGLDGFTNVINTLDGVDVNVTHTIVDDNYPDDINNSNDPYALERLYLPAGPQHLDGQEALDYVRSRHADLIGDFGRSARQQQVLISLKSKLDNSAIFGKLTTIANELKGSVKTDMQLTDVLKLMDFARGLNANTIQRLTLGPPYSTPGTAPAGSGVDAGASIVTPNCPQVIAALQKMFQSDISAMCNIEGDPGTSYRAMPGKNLVISPGNASSTSAITIGTKSNTSSLPDQEGVLGISSTSILDGPGDLFGVRSVLDLMVLAVFETPNALQI